VGVARSATNRIGGELRSAGGAAEAMGAAAHWEATGVEGDRDVSGGSPSLSSLFSLFSPKFSSITFLSTDFCCHFFTKFI
jgi:hypothetical protein